MTYRIVIIGPQGSGKNTQAELLAKKLGIPAISAGDLLREVAASNAPEAKQVQAILNQGKMVPNEITNALIRGRAGKADAKNGFILDGYPRDHPQLEYMEGYAPATAVIALQLSDKEAVARLGGRRVCTKCGRNYHIVHNPPRHEGVCDLDGAPLTVRDDDKPKAIRERLQIYHDESEPLLEIWRPRGLVHEINAAQSIEKVHDDIMRALSKA